MMFVAVVLVCIQAIAQDMRDCSVGSAIQIIKLERRAGYRRLGFPQRLGA
jgi:hypothetical protein